MEGAFYHRPVLLPEVIQALAVRPGAVYLDCTVGEGGHAQAVLRESTPGGRLLGIDLDPQAIDAARHRLSPFGDRAVLAQGSFSAIQEIVAAFLPGPFDGILFDLGLSSLQLEGEERGFSFQREEPLDMRFDPQQPLTAAELVNTTPMGKLIRILREYGEEPRARVIANAILQHRPLRTARELAEVVLRAVGRGGGRIHPATRTFQAVRIAVNRELEALRLGLEQALALLKPGGRLLVISYHSLEDRIVKQTFAREARGCLCPPGAPQCICGHTPSLRLLWRRGITPSLEEIRENPRSRSARLRGAEHL